MLDSTRDVVSRMSFEETMRLAQQRGFFFKAAESYPNSPAGFWDYGPLGVSLKNRFVELWRRLLVKKDGMVEIDGAQGEDAYLRPETCQTIFVDSPLLFKTQRVKLPVGFAQYGKSFRNEIAPRQGLIRLRELNQAEVEVFFNPRTAEGVEKFGSK